MNQHLHVIGVGGIGVSAVARYYLAHGWHVTGTDASASQLTDTLATEGVDFSVGEHPEKITPTTSLVVYTEAILRNGTTNIHPELARTKALNVRAIPYPVALGEIANKKRLIAVCGSHGKSTTTAMLAVALRASGGGSAVVGTQVPQLGGKNCIFDATSDLFTIEACEYRRSFLQYFPAVTIITNIDLDHLDYYKDEADYVSAFQQLVDQTKEAVIITGNDRLSQQLDLRQKKKIEVFDDHFVIHPVSDSHQPSQTIPLPKFRLQVPGDHLAQDARLALCAGLYLNLPEKNLVTALQGYTGSWRRSEIIKTTAHGNLLLSDYGHHPTEIAATLSAIKQKYADKKLIVCFQPHQYSRTRELLEGFKNCFGAADILIIPDIYFSRDSDADIAAMPVEKLIATLRENHPDVRGGKGLEDAAILLRELDIQNSHAAVLVLLGAGSVDDLRQKI